jgi:predicted nucleic acid-binding Zn ribbon protein
MGSIVGDLTSFGSSLDDVFRRLGLPDPVVMSKVSSDWAQVVGSPWAERSRPLFIQGTTLVVEASAPSMVAFLRYGVADLLQALAGHLGEGVIDQIEVRPPGPR